MEIVLSKYAGFCEGVARAYEIAEKVAKDSSFKRPVFMLGSLVHNSDAVQKLEEMGIRKIKVESNPLETLRNFSEEIGTLIVTAHGTGPEIFEFAKNAKIEVVDTTCPKVIKVQRLAKHFSEKDYQLIIVGEKNHKEVRGVYGWAKNDAVIIETMEDVENLSADSSKKMAVVSQTTQNQDFFKKVVENILEKYPKAETLNTICETTENRQNEVKELAKNSDVIVVIGSPESSNSNKLFEIAKEINLKTFFIQRSRELQKNWFLECEKVAVTAGASTPKWIIKETIEKLKKM